jgi:hypothetical protein
MSRRFVGFAALLAACLGLFTQGARAQDTPAPKAKRALYVVRYADASELAGVLAKHFKGDADVQAVPSRNALLLRAAPAVLDEVTKLIDELDRRPRLVSVELLFVEATAKADDKGLDEKQFSGTEKAVLEKIESLKKEGVIGGLRRFRFTAVEGVPASVAVGESRPYTQGVSGGFGGKGAKGGAGPVSRSVSFRETGTVARATVRVQDGKGVTLDLDLSDSRPYLPRDAVVIGQDENGAPVHMMAFAQAMLKSKLSIPAGQVVAAKDVQTTSKSGQARTLILATARVVEPESGGK